METSEGPKKADPGAPERRSIFRAEALAHRARAEGPGGVVRFTPSWSNWAFYALIGIFATTVIVASLVRIDRWVPGTFTNLEDGTIVLLVPAALAADVEPGAPVELGRDKTEVTAVLEEVFSPAEIHRRYGVEVTAPTIVLMTAAHRRTRPGPDRVLVESEAVIVALVPGLKALFGDG